VSPAERPLLLALPPVWGPEARRALVRLLFVDLRVPSLYLTTPAVLALYACGRTDGLVVDAGYSSISAVPISGGRPVRAATGSVAFGGRNLVSRLMAPGGAMAEAGLTGESDRELAAAILARLGYVAASPSLERLRSEPEVAGEYTLPSGRVVRLAHARHAAFEPLFAPSPADGGEPADGGGEGVSLPRLLADAAMAAPAELRADMLRSVLVVGGVSLAPGFTERLQAELAPLLPAELRPAVRVFAPRARQHTAWAGGAALAAQLTGLWVAKAAFDASPDAALAALEKQTGL
jgi:actin-related protein